jgi:hypothetical protein
MSKYLNRLKYSIRVFHFTFILGIEAATTSKAHNMQHATCNTTHATCITTHDMQHDTHNMRHDTRNMQRDTHNMQHDTRLMTVYFKMTISTETQERRNSRETLQAVLWEPAVVCPWMGWGLRSVARNTESVVALLEGGRVTHCTYGPVITLQSI